MRTNYVVGSSRHESDNHLAKTPHVDAQVLNNRRPHPFAFTNQSQQ